MYFTLQCIIAHSLTEEDIFNLNENTQIAKQGTYNFILYLYFLYQNILKTYVHRTLGRSVIYNFSLERQNLT